MKTGNATLAAALLLALFSLLPAAGRAQNDDPMEEWLEMGDFVHQLTSGSPTTSSDESAFTSPCPFPFQDLKTIAVNPSGRDYIRRLRTYFPDATIRMTGLPQLKDFVSAHSDVADVYVTPDKPVFRDASKQKITVPQSVVEFEYPNTFNSYFRKRLFVKKPDLGKVEYILVTPIGPFFAVPYGKKSVNFYFFSPKF